MPKTPKDSFAFDDGHGTTIVVSVDDVYDDDHPYVKAYPTNFVDHEVETISAPKRAVKKVEQASAAPGEERDATPPKSRKFGTVTDQ